MPQEEWSKSARYLVLVLMLVLGAWFLYAIRTLIGALVVSALIAYILAPMVRFLSQRFRLPKRIAVFAVYIQFLAVLVIIPILITPRMILQIGDMDLQLRELQVSIESYLDQITILGNPLPDNLISFDIQTTFAALLHPQQLITSFQVASTNLAWVLISVVSVYYFMSDADKLKSWLLRAFPPPYQGDTQRLYDRIAKVWEAYFRGQFVLMLFVGVITYASMAAIGLPGAFFIGLLAGLLDIVPSVGPALVAIIATVIAFFEGSNYFQVNHVWFALLVITIFIIIQVSENIWLRPRVMGSRLHLHPALIFIGVIAALALSGVLAALLIVPVMSSIGILGYYGVRRIVGADPWGGIDRSNSEV